MTAAASCGCGTATCGCCSGVAVVTPRAIDNRPGLSTLSVRIGTHGDFLGSLQARLSGHRLAGGSRPLAQLRTRDRDDASIALLDAFACVGDVLTFYNERVANEGYLRTATEFRSVTELARLIGYAPRPGVAASVYLAFDIDSNTKTAVTIAKSMRVQSVPGQDELPQSFETSDDLIARAAWNRIGVRLAAPQMLAGDDRKLYLAGTATGLKPGDALLFEFDGVARPEPMRVVSVAPDTDADRTLVMFDPWLPDVVTEPRLVSPIAAAPAGAIARDIAALAIEIQAAAPDRVATLAAGLKARIAATRASLTTRPGTPLRNWLDALEAWINAVAAAPIGPAVTTTAAGAPANRVDARIARLAAAPSTPPASSARLARQSDTSFALGAGSTLQMLNVAAPAVGASYAVALVGDLAAAPPQPLRVWALRLRAGLFGRAFPKRTRSVDIGNDGETFETEEIGEWPIRTVTRVENTTAADTRREEVDTVTLDASYDGVATGSWMMIDMSNVAPSAANWIVRPTDRLLIVPIDAVDAKRARADYGGSGDSTALRTGGGAPWIEYNEASTDEDDDNGDRLDLNDQATIDREFQLIRRTTVYARAELLALAEAPIEAPFCVADVGDAVELSGLYADLEPGRYVIVSGERTDIADTVGVPANEVAMIARVVHDVRRADGTAEPLGEGKQALPGDRIHSFIWLAEPLSYCYRRDSVVIRGNVVKATHGETRTEVLGNGDAARSNQRFALKQAPLTFVAAATARGAASTLEVLVDDVRWREAEHLIDADAADRHYMLRAGSDGHAQVVFGDGHEGARPSTGAQNVRAVYRTGIGRSGNLRAGQIEQLATRPLGVRGVTNPLAATGGADPEGRDQARRNAPLTTMALDRLVSVRDHADFARTFAGIAKAEARLLSDGERRFIHLTIAAEGDAALDATTDLVIALKRALVALGDPHQPVIVAPRELRLLIIEARIAIEPDRVWEVVVGAARARLLDRFGFEHRRLTEGLAASATIAALQAVPGVVYVDLDIFGSVATMATATRPDGKRFRLPRDPASFSQGVAEVAAARVSSWEEALPARSEAGDLLPAELLMLSPDVPATLILNEIR